MNVEEAIKRPFTFINIRGEKITKEYDLYEQTQELRSREREMRKTRANIAGLKAGGDGEGYRTQKGIYTEQRKEYLRFLSEMNYEKDGKTLLNKSGFRHVNGMQSRVLVDGLGRL